MNRKKWLLPILLVLLLTAAALLWGMSRYVIVDMALYPKHAAYLDLRDRKITVSHYEKLTRALPGCEIRWNVPFQNTAYPQDVTQITVTVLSEADLEAIAYLPELETVRAEDCRDYGVLNRLREENPGLDVQYHIRFSDGTALPWDAESVTVCSVEGEDAALLQYLPRLKQVTVTGGGEKRALEAFRGMSCNLGLDFYVGIGGKTIAGSETAVTLEGMTDEEIPLLDLLVSMQTLHIRNPEASVENLLALREEHPDVTVTWDVEIGGAIFDDTMEEVDLSAATVEDLAELERRMAYLPEAKRLILGLCGIDPSAWGDGGRQDLAVCQLENEDLAAFRDRVREQYKVVWTVRLGPEITLRTDAESFSPAQFGVERLYNDHAGNLRYCEDMVCLDVGNTRVSDIRFVEGMPRLKYLVLTGTEVQYLDPLGSCPELVLLELDNSCLRDYSPLVQCTSLEDLNIGKRYCDLAPVLNMTWLKNLFLVLEKGESAAPVLRALPDTQVTAGGNAAVRTGWQTLEHYLEMCGFLENPDSDSK